MVSSAAKAKEAQARKARLKAARKRPPPTVSPSALRRLKLFKKLPDRTVDQLVAVAEGVVYGRDDMLIAPGSARGTAYLNFVVAGQIGCAEHTDVAQRAVGAKTKAEVFKKVGQTLTVFGRGDFFSDDFATRSGGLCIYSITESQVVRVKTEDVARILKAHPAVLTRLREHAHLWMERLRQLRDGSGRDEVFDFYVKNGFSFSTRTKIRQLELCIDCDKCVTGCEDRHGFARIERFGPQIGLVNFSVTCRQCYDPRCLIDCNFDAIARDQVSGEIRIEIENCTGCGVCARNCPNDSIFLHETAGREMSLWDDLGKKTPRRVAQKCDRCAGYDDMACVSACPTGSMVDAIPEDIFHLSSAISVGDTCTTDPFERGWSERATPRILPKIMYFAAALLMLGSTVEWALRRWAPHLALWPIFADDLTRAEAFTPSRGLGYWFGIVGALCMTATLIYVIRTRFETRTHWMGGKYFWFALHNALGVLGPALIFLHGNLLFAKWPAIGVYAMTAVVLSGFLGQYLANKLPGREYAKGRERQELDASLQKVSASWGEHTRAVNMVELMLKEQARQKSEAELSELGTLRFLGEMVTADVRRMRALLGLRFGQLKGVKNRDLRRQVYALMRDKLKLEDQERFYRAAGRLMSQWKSIHIVFTIGLFLLMVLHVAVVTVF